MNTDISSLMLEWYDTHARELPWRIPPHSHQKPDPYHIWLSEIMLQQTTVATVKEYYHKFINIWPTVQDLANASQDEVMTAWAGLGYYSRARNLHKTAQIITNDYNEIFPDTEAELIKLSGIGPYSAASISAIAFDKPSAVMDGNIERIISRLYCVTTPLPTAKKELYELTKQLTPLKRAGDYAQSMMDLGATICTPKKPYCGICPIKTHCQAYKNDTPENYPYKLPKVKKPTYHGAIFLLVTPDHQIVIEKRPNNGLFGGMEIFPYYNPHEHTRETGKNALSVDDMFNQVITGTLGITKQNIGSIKHVFTHFTFHADLILVPLNCYFPEKNRRLIPIKSLNQIALPTLMQKALKFYKNNPQMQLI